MHRGRELLQVLDQYERTVKPSFESYIMPTKKYADIIVRHIATLLEVLIVDHNQLTIIGLCRSPGVLRTKLPLT